METGPLPRLSGADLPFWEGLREGEIRLQGCRHCGTVRFPASRWCTACHREGADRVVVEPTGTIETFCIFQKPYFAGLPPPYGVIQVRLDCGVRVFSNMAGTPPGRLAIGSQVTAVFDLVTPDVTLLRFRPVGETSP